MKKKNVSKRSGKRHFMLLPLAIILICLGLACDLLYPAYSQVINNALGKSAKASNDYIEQALANSKEVNIAIQEEGSVLLKNDRDVLPINHDVTSKINVYGVLSAHLYKGGSGSSSNNSEGVDLKTALESEGFEINEKLWNVISEAELGYETGSTVDNGVAGQYELPIKSYESAVSFEEAKAYSDYALVTFGTNGGEGSDGDRGDTNSLELGKNEIALLEKLHDEGFKVIALINSSYVMELGPVIENVDSILWIGGTGLYGTYGIASILSGEINPSGRLVDTWMYEQETSSTYYTSDNANSFYLDSDGNQIGSYSNYSEGIYVGYRWYETADAEGYWDTVSNKYGNGYDGVVAYPFGYGLSYTIYEERIISSSYEDGKIVVNINATNTGSVAGKDVIELYVQKPYVEGGVEVAQMELVGFAKTGLLAPGESTEVTLSVNDENLVSYDATADNGKGCYVLTGGEYTFYLASATSGAHCWKTFSGDSSHFVSYTLDEKIYDSTNKRESDYVAATNLLETTDNDTNVACNDATAGFLQLSREDGFANADESISKEANTRDGIINGNVKVASDSNIYRALKDNYGNNTYSNFNPNHLAEVSEFTNASLGVNKKYTIDDLFGAEYDDHKWDALISQMSIEEIEELIGRGGYGTIAVESIGKLAATDYDGPTGFSNFLKASLDIEQETTGFCSEPIMAATYNTELITQYGEAVGIEGNAFGNNGWYAPGMNIHRTPFEGRTGEYFSEDPFLTGMMGAAVASGAFEKGVYTYAKHFAFNELEANRSNGMNCVMTEQTAREIYLRPFEIAIKQGALTGMMSSFMLMNAQWNGGNFNLMHGIVRTEWNFKGVINTDLAGAAIMGAERALCAGTDLLLATSYGQNARSAYLRCDTIKTTDNGILAMKTAAKHILYAYSSAASNREVAIGNVNTTIVKVIFVIINLLAYGGALALLFLFVITIRKKGSKTSEVREKG